LQVQPFKAVLLVVVVVKRVLKGLYFSLNASFEKDLLLASERAKGVLASHLRCWPLSSSESSLGRLCASGRQAD
jgi:hypothetical protein